ncbi:MAG: phosphotransferase, partial [Pseudomonadota bacterium]
MTTHNPTADLARAAGTFATHYGKPDARARSLPGEKDLNYLIVRAGEPVAVFKLMHPDTPDDVVALQCDVLAHAGDRGVALPPVLARVDGAHVGTVDWADGARTAYAIGFCAGTRQADLPPLGDNALRELGGAIARLDRALADFDHPALDRPQSWNLTEAAAHARHCHHIAAPLDRVSARVLARFSREAASALAALPAQAIHNDLNDHNVLLNVAAFTPSVNALIDVGDCARQPVICELAIACAYSAMRQRDPVGACAALAAGFHAEHALEVDEVDLLPLLIKSRLAVSLAVSSRRAADGAADPYQLVSQRDAADLLAALESVPEGVFRLRLRAALGLPGLPH